MRFEKLVVRLMTGGTKTFNAFGDGGRVVAPTITNHLGAALLEGYAAAGMRLLV